MDDLNEKRREKGQQLSFHGRDENEVNDILTEACKMVGYNGRTYTGPRSNPVGDYRLSIWQPFGEFPEYVVPTEVAKLIGYELVATQRDGDGWFSLYFDAKEDRGGCLRRVDIWEGEAQGICRSDVLDDGLVDPLSRFTTVKGQNLMGVEAYRSGRLVLNFDAGAVDVEWDCPLDPDKRPEASDVVRVRGKADFDRILVAQGD